MYINNKEIIEDKTINGQNNPIDRHKQQILQIVNLLELIQNSLFSNNLFASIYVIFLKLVSFSFLYFSNLHKQDISKIEVNAGINIFKQEIVI
ncbi:unnamed protein product (macronuclear) [Paramecium tetraurelia]|uniref:Uncharacterized protein n=1 Tax=Paramecium tetraurelia TaxID=5888 RepID=A0DJR1_PARTE|nr:uncharacterized protein GSPATT00017622001 [Paramecium tetraurelia]CAK83278.1 unnamed protein product [Paramecium tetraurelia]|eukprot:XP_001450675.1 hypothetical protein (macronuclear) [Paramecium tetraurelia strain d4-2]